MARQATSLAGLLRAELKHLTPDQVALFRAELVRVLPATIEVAAEVARAGNNVEIDGDIFMSEHLNTMSDHQLSQLSKQILVVLSRRTQICNVRGNGT